MSKRWSDLSPRTRRLIVVGGLIETGLKIAVVVDLRKREPEEIRGSKRAWGAALALNSFGAVPIAYFIWGRRDTGR